MSHNRDSNTTSVTWAFCCSIWELDFELRSLVTLCGQVNQRERSSICGVGDPPLGRPIVHSLHRRFLLSCCDQPNRPSRLTLGRLEELATCKEEGRIGEGSLTTFCWINWRGMCEHRPTSGPVEKSDLVTVIKYRNKNVR
jgi:hypothetical protein